MQEEARETHLQDHISNMLKNLELKSVFFVNRPEIFVSGTKDPSDITSAQVRIKIGKLGNSFCICERKCI